ncbi:MAG: D-alanyl-D-alanine carboxypeptidase/D-alanyl-D-alanine-endopeptidase [Bacteriovoracaceae bacterium]|nr:D-alanyl-D-alanine carboxypeptidase/D-alanyl-D-alanine-endopeptidase [Bacteriovoracaceae bacterium]
MKYLRFIPLLFCLLQVSLVRASSEMELEFKKLIKKHHFSESSLGLFVDDEGKSIVDINAGSLMVPASLTKIVTGGAILTLLPLNKKFTTELWSKAPIEGANMKGSLCLKGGGDPSFVSEKMWYLVNEFVRTNTLAIEGDLLIDNSRFDSENFDSGRDSRRVDRAFDAPVSASSFNWNSVNVYIRPGKIGEPTQVFLDPKNDYLILENNSKTVAKNGVKGIDVSRVTINSKDKIIVSGSLSSNAPEMVVYKSISNPDLWLGSHLKEFLSQRGVSLKGKVKVGTCEKGSVLLASVQSKNLVEMTSDMLKFSNNFVAEMLVKNLAADDIMANGLNKSANMKDGIESLKKYLDKLGFKRKDYVLENVSGLTRDNRFTARQLSTVLTSIRNDFLIFPEFLSGLPIAGVDGTMKNRLKNNDGVLVRAKTGYLDGVVGLAGFIGRPNESALSFVFMFNGSFEQGLAARNLFDEMLSKLVLK